MAEEVGEVTEEQASDALREIMTKDSLEVVEPTQAPVEQSAQTETTPEAEAPVETPVAQADDLRSLEERQPEADQVLKEAEDRFNLRLEALKRRNAENEQILRDRYLRKSTVADRALSVLRATRSEGGVPEADVDQAIREMEGTMNPQSASYVPPQQQAPQATEDQALVLNSFLNEKGMTLDEADEFGRWIRSDAEGVMSPAEQAVANQSIDGFLRLAHNRWQDGIAQKQREAKRDDAVGAVRSVQRTQREAARAASSAPTVPKQVAGETEVDVGKLTKDDVSTLLRQTVEQYR
jgi:hypothetical protein